MDFVVLDLEWNGAYSRRLGGFLNEIIEMGAARAGRAGAPPDTFQALVRPQVGKKISGKIQALTSITDEDLEGGLRFQQAVSRFAGWAGGAVVMTWGTSDILTLIDNYRYFRGDDRIPFLKRYVDLQAYCERKLGRDPAQQTGLETAARLLGIDPASFSQHRALGDSLLELECFRRLYDPAALEPFIQDAERRGFYDRMEFRTTEICDLHHPLIRPADLSFCCDLCGRKARRVGRWQLRNKSFRAEFLCRHCGHRFCGRVQFKLKYEGMSVRKAILPSRREKKEKEAAQAAEKSGEEGA